MTPQNIIIIGGGGGSSALIKTLKHLVYNKKINSITSLVTNTDDGGSTGKLRDWYNTIAWGDITNNILAMVNTTNKDHIINALQCRFNVGDLEGHTLRNIFILGLSLLDNCDDICAINEMRKLLNIDKNLQVYPIINIPGILRFKNKYSFISPITKKKTKVITGQKIISVDLPIQKISRSINDYKIDVIGKQKTPQLHSKSRIALQKAHYIIISPGHTHGSIIPALATPNLSKYIKTKKLIYIIPFFNRLDIYHTNGWTSSNYVEFYNKYLGRQPDYIIVNTNYKRTLAGQEWVINDLESYDNTVVIKGNLLSTTYSSKKTHCPKTTSNKVVRSPIGFDNKKMLKVLSNIMK